jgi:hypothetical protein
VLAAGASATDDFYKGMVLRITGGTLGVYQIREIVKYVGATKTAYLRAWTAPTGTVTYEIAEGMVFEKMAAPAFEVYECRRICYDAAANPAGGAQKKYYEKIFARNLHETLALTNAVIKEVSGGLSGKFAFALETSLGGSDTTTDRLTAPGGYTFNSTDKNVANSQNHSSGASQGIWLELTLDGGDAANDSYYTLQEQGQST